MEFAWYTFFLTSSLAEKVYQCQQGPASQENSSGRNYEECFGDSPEPLWELCDPAYS